MFAWSPMMNSGLCISLCVARSMAATSSSMLPHRQTMLSVRAVHSFLCRRRHLPNDERMFMGARKEQPQILHHVVPQDDSLGGRSFVPFGFAQGPQDDSRVLGLPCSGRGERCGADARQPQILRHSVPQDDSLMVGWRLWSLSGVHAVEGAAVISGFQIVPVAAQIFPGGV